MSTWLIFMLVAAVLAIIVSGLLIGVCLLIAWVTDAFRGSSDQRGSWGQEAHRMGGARPGPPGVGGAQPGPRGVAEGRHRHGSGPPVAYRHGNR